MGTTGQPDALLIAEEFESFAIDHKPDGWPAIRQKKISAAAAELRRLHAENTALQAGYDAARLEIESLKAKAPASEYPPLPQPFRRQGAQAQADGESAVTCDLFCIEQMRAYVDADRAARARTAPAVPVAAIGSLLNQAMEQAVSNGANSISMPDEIVEIAAWLAGLGAKAAPAAPSRMSDEMRRFIEGMAVSVDVSTCDADEGHRYFGTVTEVMDDITDKHGVVLLVQSAKPNFTAPAVPAALASNDAIAKRRASYLRKDTDAGRAYVAQFFKGMGSNVFDDYIRNDIAGDFACELAAMLATQAAPEVPAAVLDAVMDAFEQKERGKLAAHIAAELVAELRAMLAAASSPSKEQP